MKTFSALAAVALTVSSSPALAQGVTGGELAFEYNAPTDGSAFGGTTYSGGIEFGINRDFSVALDARGFSSDELEVEGTNVTLHGIYHLNGATSIGVYAGRDRLDITDTTSDNYGIEAGTELNGAIVGGYLGRTDDGAEDATLYGIDGAYDLRNGYSVIGDLDGVSVSDEGDDLSIMRISVGGQYEIQGGPQLYAEIGTVRASAGGITDSQGFVAIGARVAFGASRGTTFDSRSAFTATTGF